jgi:hypothetical protein
MTPVDINLYNKVKTFVNKKYKKNSAYRSMAYIKEYKRRNGLFVPDGEPKPLLRWQREQWKDINPNATRRSYPVFRPTIRINRDTPTTVDEISTDELTKQINRKQKIKGKSNLRAFTRKNSNKYKN